MVSAWGYRLRVLDSIPGRLFIAISPLVKLLQNCWSNQTGPSSSSSSSSSGGGGGTTPAPYYVHPCFKGTKIIPSEIAPPPPQITSKRGC